LVGTGLEIHFAKKYRKARVRADWIKERITPDWRHHRVALINGTVHPSESLVKFA
jgi:hypothetical protein